MSYQTEFDFETLEQKEQRLKDWRDQEAEIDKMKPNPPHQRHTQGCF